MSTLHPVPTLGVRFRHQQFKKFWGVPKEQSKARITGLHLSSCSQSVVLGQVASAWAGNLLEMHILRPHPRLTESKTLGGDGAFQGILLHSQVWELLFLIPSPPSPILCHNHTIIMSCSSYLLDISLPCPLIPNLSSTVHSCLDNHLIIAVPSSPFQFPLPSAAKTSHNKSSTTSFLWCLQNRS